MLCTGRHECVDSTQVDALGETNTGFDHLCRDAVLGSNVIFEARLIYIFLLAQF